MENIKISGYDCKEVSDPPSGRMGTKSQALLFRDEVYARNWGVYSTTTQSHKHIQNVQLCYGFVFK